MLALVGLMQAHPWKSEQCRRGLVSSPEFGESWVCIKPRKYKWTSDTSRSWDSRVGPSTHTDSMSMLGGLWKGEEGCIVV